MSGCECPTHRCLIAPSTPKFVRCRPCAVGWHDSRPCAEYVRLPLWHLDHSCHRCGFDSAAHAERPG